MPIDPVPQHSPSFPYSVTLPMKTGLNLAAQIYDDGQQAPGYMDEMLQSLVDLLQTWEHRLPGANVSGQKYDLLMWLASPTDPEVSDPPEVDPNDPGGV